MDKKSSLAERIKQKIEENQKNPKHCFIGFDGFTDEIISCVDTRDKTSFKKINTVEDFSKRTSKAAGRSCNIELVVTQKKLGGNGPILTNALLEGGHRITFAGNIGEKNAIEPLFQQMASRCEKVFPLGPSAHSDALEFNDGKIILGKLSPLEVIDYPHLIHCMGKDELIKTLDQSDLFVAANWTMIPHMTTLWQNISNEILPLLSPKERWFFLDLADPAKRTKQDIIEAIKTLKTYKSIYKILIGLNTSEALQLHEALIGPTRCETKEEVLKTAENLRKITGFDAVVIHPIAFAVFCSETSRIVEDGIVVKNPLLSTGGGDNFNAGLLNALLLGLSDEEMLLCAVATSGYYVSHGKSPSAETLYKFLNEWKTT